MIWIIGGTYESHEFIEKLKAIREDYIVSVATEGGLEFLNTDKYYVGRLSYDEMKLFIDEHGIEKIVDMSHPFAAIVTEMAKKVAEEKNIDYYRYLRENWKTEGNSILVDSYESAYEQIKKLEGNFLFTTGSKFVENFEAVRGENRFIYRMLPTSESISMAEKAGVSMKDIVGLLGPFTVELNEILFKLYNINYCVTKESGGNSGFKEKIIACENMGVIPIIIKRREEDGYQSMEEILQMLEVD